MARRRLRWRSRSGRAPLPRTAGSARPASVPRHMSTGSSTSPPGPAPGGAAGGARSPGWPTADRCEDDGRPRARPRRGRPSAPHGPSRRRPSTEDRASTPVGATVLDQDPRDRAHRARSGPRPRTARREVDPDARLLGPAPAAERAAPAVAAAGRVAAGRGRLPAERPGAAQQDRVLGRDAGWTPRRRSRRSTAATSATMRRRPRSPRGRARPAHSSRIAAGAAMLVIQLTSVPPPTALPGEDRDRAVPGRHAGRGRGTAGRTRRARSSASSARRRTARPRARRRSGRHAASSAATTPPPAPEPTMTTSASSATVLRGRPGVHGEARAGRSARGRGSPAAGPARSRSRRAAGSDAVRARLRVGEEASGACAAPGTPTGAAASRDSPHASR